MAESDGWSHVAGEWAQLWGAFTRPAQRALLAAARIGDGTRVLDVGCGTGEFLELLRQSGAQAQGIEPAEGMRAVAAQRGFVVHRADAEHLPLADAAVDVVTAVNALQFADDEVAALREFSRVLMPGGRVAVATWAEHGRNDVAVIERALAEADDAEPPADEPLGEPGGLERAFADAGLRVAASGIVNAPWHAADEATLVRGILLGEDDAGLAELGPVVVEAAAPFRDATGGYVLRNALRWAVGTPR